MSNRKYTLEEFKQAVLESTSIRSALLKLGLNAAGNAYTVFKRFADDNNVDLSHFTGQIWNKGMTIGPKRELDEYLSNSMPIQSNKLRLRLLKEGIFKHKCDVCGNSTWLDKPIPLELDHINGNNQDNEISNLRLICPNCHAFTPTYRGKNKKKA